MLRSLSFALPALLMLTAAPLAGDMPPPQGALRLSQIVAMIEATEGFRYIDEVEWDDDGYWEIAYLTSDGRKIEVKIDPMTGDLLR